MIADLKSNMDRFIVIVPDGLVDTILNLKSNMDRFIVKTIYSNIKQYLKFKIQYG